MLRILIINSDYESFLSHFYDSNPSLAEAPYAKQLAARYDSMFGVADFYSRNFRALGHDAKEVFVNNPVIQATWACEHGMSVDVPSLTVPQPQGKLLARLRHVLNPYRAVLAPVARRIGLLARLETQAFDILQAQIDDFAPDVILNQSVLLTPAAVVKAWQKPGRVIIAQQGTGLPKGFDIGGYDFAVTMLPYLVEQFRIAGLPAEQVHLAFEPDILDRLPPAPPKDIAVSFVGGLAAGHQDRIRLLEAISKRYPVMLFSSSTAGLPANSPILQRRQDGVWGTEMYQVLRRSRITLNSHIDAARGFAGNMRLFEATGVGTCLLTDNQSNLASLFASGVEVATYESADDCVSQIERLLADDARREEIARRGQERTFAKHTYRQRAEQLLDYVARYGR